MPRAQSHTGGPRVTIDHRTVVLDEDGNEVKPGSGVRGIIAKKGNIPVGYYKDEKKTAETFKTINGVRYAIPGDYAEVEADGSVTLLGRGSVSINSGGEKIYPEEVEAALKGHPDVFDALVVGVPDARFGQHVAAVVQPRDRAPARRWPSWTRSCAPRSRDTKCRAAFGCVDEVKRSPAGKPDYRWAKDTTEERPADDVHAKHVGAQRPRCAPNCATASASTTRSSSSPRRRRWPRRSARPAGSACSAASGSTTPTTSRRVLHWMDENTDGKPYGVDIVMPAKVPTEGTSVDINKLIPQSHRDFVDKTLADLGVPPLPEDEERSEGVLGWLHSVARVARRGGAQAPDQADRQRARARRPKDVIDQVHAAGVPVAALAGSAKHAQRHVDNGVDIVIAQGHEAGGHTGEIASMVLVPEIVDALGGQAAGARRRRHRHRPPGRGRAGARRAGRVDGFGVPDRGRVRPRRAHRGGRVGDPAGAARARRRATRCAAASTPASRRGC